MTGSRPPTEACPLVQVQYENEALAETAPNSGC